MEYLKVKGIEKYGVTVDHRRQLMAFLIFTIMALSLTTACGDDDPTGLVADDIVGVWIAYKITFYFGSIDSPDDVNESLLGPGTGAQSTLIINNDNTWSFIFEEEESGFVDSSSGTWSISGNKISFGETDDPDGTSVEISVSGNNLTLTASRTIDGYTTYDVVEYTRQ